jgi:hypothetical protein
LPWSIYNDTLHAAEIRGVQFTAREIRIDSAYDDIQIVLKNHGTLSMFYFLIHSTKNVTTNKFFENVVKLKYFGIIKNQHFIH